MTEKNENILSFSEYWSNLSKTDKPKFRALRSGLEMLLEKGEAAIRQNMRENSFKGIEKSAITAYIAEFEQNNNITVNQLFPVTTKQVA